LARAALGFLTTTKVDACMGCAISTYIHKCIKTEL
jgi:hypothetical protein